MRRRLFTLLALLLVAPASAQAEVFINEVAWMGTDESGTCEWIELYNDGDSVVDLSAWTLTVTNPGSAKVILLGEETSAQYTGIASRGFYLLARKSTSCSPPVADSLVDWLGSFGNGISNEGAKLELSDGASVVDTVDALEDGWSESGIGGTNAAPKKTPQYTGSGWSVAAPTPRATNSAPDEPELEDPEDEEAPPVVTVGGSAPSLPVEDPIVKLHLASVPSRIVLAGAATPFRAVAYDGTGEVRRDAKVRWSFGDGSARNGAHVQYAYREPGEYTAVVRADVRDGFSATALVSVVVEAPTVRIKEVTEKGVAVENPSERLADLSSWKLRSGTRVFTLPEDTVVAPGKAALLPWAVMRLPTSTDPVLLYPDGSPVYPQD